MIVNPAISQVDATSLSKVLDHLERHLAESGAPATPVFGPFPPRTPPGWSTGPKRAEFEAGLATPLGKPRWCRIWALADADRVVGHVMLNGGRMAYDQHRATLGIGIEEAYRGRGSGAELLRTAIDWARSQNDLAWIDLNVFAHNRAAVALYERAGFQTLGSVDDRFRIDGESIQNVQMALRV